MNIASNERLFSYFKANALELNLTPAHPYLIKFLIFTWLLPEGFPNTSKR